MNIDYGSKENGMPVVQHLPYNYRPSNIKGTGDHLEWGAGTKRGRVNDFYAGRRGGGGLHVNLCRDIE